MMTERDFHLNLSSPEKKPDFTRLYKPWSATPSGSALDNPLVAQRLDSLRESEEKMVTYGRNDPDFAEMADFVETAHIMRHQARITKASFANSEVLYPEAVISSELRKKDEIGCASQHEHLYIMKKRGMKSKELGKVTHLYGGEAMGYVDTMYQETMNYLSDLETLSLGLQDNCLEILTEEDFKYAKDAETLELMKDTLVGVDGSVANVEIMNTPDHAYYRVASRDWTAPESPNIIMLKRKHRLGRVGGAEVVMRTSFIVNLDWLSSSVDYRVLNRVCKLEYNKEWSEKILSDEVGLIKEIDRLGLTKDLYSFILVSTTIYAKDPAVEKSIETLRQAKKEAKRTWSPTFNRFT